MAHRSENAQPLAVQPVHISAPAELPMAVDHEPAVWFVAFPYHRSFADDQDAGGWIAAIEEFARRLEKQSILCILTTPADAANLWPRIQHDLRFQLSVSIQLNQPIPSSNGGLPQAHAELLVLSKYDATLKHTKTRIAYTYCPFCDRTTKDYGGKKHTYDPYGTLLSDVWRDIRIDLTGDLDVVTNRLADLFGLEPFRRLRRIDLREVAALKPASAKSRAARRTVNSSTGSNSGEAETGLFNGDCLEVLRSIPNNSIDFCFSDPPYNLSKKYDGSDDAKEITEYFNWCDKWLGELARVLKPGRTLAVLNIPQWTIRHATFLKTILDYQAWITWEGLSLPVRMIMPANYSIVCFSKGDPRPLPGLSHDVVNDEANDVTGLTDFACMRAGCVASRRRGGNVDRIPLTDLWWDIHRLKHNSRRVDHPCQLPPLLMRRLIALHTKPGEVVLDPFNGAGTTSLVAQMMGRRFVGIELSENYHRIADDRHRELRMGIDPFGKKRVTPQAKNNHVQRLKKQKYAVSKKTLQLEVRRIARELGRLPTREEVACRTVHRIEYYDDYFLSWGEVCAAARNAGMVEHRETDRPLQKVRQLSLFKEHTSSV